MQNSESKSPHLTTLTNCIQCTKKKDDTIIFLNIKNTYTHHTQCGGGTLKVMPPILLCWPMTSEADGGGMVIDVEPFY